MSYYVAVYYMSSYVHVLYSIISYILCYSMVDYTCSCSSCMYVLAEYNRQQWSLAIAFDIIQQINDNSYGKAEED